MAKTLDSAAVYVSERPGEGAARTDPVGGLQRVGTDVDHTGEEGIALSLAFGRRDQAGRIELVGDEDVVERPTGSFQVNVARAIADELLLTVGPDRPLGRDQGTAVLRIAHDSQINDARFLAVAWFVESRNRVEG